MVNGLLNPTHIVILLVVVLLFLGPKKLPDTGRSLGRAMREFRDGITGRENTPAETATYAPPSADAAANPPPPALAAPAPPEHATPVAGENTAATAGQAAPANAEEVAA